MIVNTCSIQAVNVRSCWLLAAINCPTTGPELTSAAVLQPMPNILDYACTKVR